MPTLPTVLPVKYFVVWNRGGYGSIVPPTATSGPFNPTSSSTGVPFSEDLTGGYNTLEEAESELRQIKMSFRALLYPHRGELKVVERIQHTVSGPSLP